MDSQRALLDELMGAARNMTEEEKKGYREIKWDDREVCAFYMVHFCPHDFFVNTRSDLGPCPRIHDQKLKERLWTWIEEFVEENILLKNWNLDRLLQYQQKSLNSYLCWRRK